MANQPKDHQPKKPKAPKRPKRTAAPDQPFEYTTESGGIITLAAPMSVLTVGWARTRRHLDLLSQFFEMVEALADTKSLEIFDAMGPAEMARFQREFYQHSGIKLGE